MQRLLMIAPAPVIRTDTGYILDQKFISGMQVQHGFWSGDFDCLLREGANHIPFGAKEVSTELGFGLRVLKNDEVITADHLDGYDVIYCSIDSVDSLDLINLRLPNRPRFFATIEYTLRTRLQIAWMNTRASLSRRIRTILWLLRQEPRRRRFVRKADGLQTNGYPAFAAYHGMNSHTLLYLDNRMTGPLFATQAERVARADRLRSGAPLRLVYSGRLELMKGAQDLVPIAKLLKARGVTFHLDIFGDGQLKQDISRQILQDDLAQDVTLHASVDFETELVPFVRENSDIYLCCHRQSDPSCSYLENMGCGLAVAGYGNQMWSALNEASGAGWVSPLGARAGMADIIAGLNDDREDIARRCNNAVTFAKSHDFVAEFEKRMTHLRGPDSG